MKALDDGVRLAKVAVTESASKEVIDIPNLQRQLLALRHACQGGLLRPSKVAKLQTRLQQPTFIPFITSLISNCKRRRKKEERIM